MWQDGAAKLWAVGVLPTISSPDEDDNRQNAQDGIGEHPQPHFRTLGWEEEIMKSSAQAFEKFSHMLYSIISLVRQPFIQAITWSKFIDGELPRVIACGLLLDQDAVIRIARNDSWTRITTLECILIGGKTQPADFGHPMT